ncbi:unnamed protein product [Trichogramma brassicae]|uniref:Uncharacterized protein n=1 Tax=Trichogramma brassicae TaxID=86971 RepID=A0A6H5IGJ5_9HYME|nr:unnamed protein product [Trichogramma brassicae]
MFESSFGEYSVFEEMFISELKDKLIFCLNLIIQLEIFQFTICLITMEKNFVKFLHHLTGLIAGWTQQHHHRGERLGIARLKLCKNCVIREETKEADLSQCNTEKHFKLANQSPSTSFSLTTSASIEESPKSKRQLNVQVPTTNRLDTGRFLKYKSLQEKSRIYEVRKVMGTGLDRRLSDFDEDNVNSSSDSLRLHPHTLSPPCKAVQFHWHRYLEKLMFGSFYTSHFGQLSRHQTNRGSRKGQEHSKVY